MTLRDTIEAAMRAASPRKGNDHPKGPKFLYHRAGTVVTKNSGGSSTLGEHQTYVRVRNPAREGKKYR